MVSLRGPKINYLRERRVYKTIILYTEAAARVAQLFLNVDANIAARFQSVMFG